MGMDPMAPRGDDPLDRARLTVAAVVASPS